MLPPSNIPAAMGTTPTTRLIVSLPAPGSPFKQVTGLTPLAYKAGLGIFGSTGDMRLGTCRTRH